MKAIFLSLIIYLFSCSAFATPTTLVVRAKAKDAKFIGSSIGGARIIVREAMSEKILAEGFTRGSTGNTQKIMEQAHQRHQLLSDEGSAAFTASLEITRPILVTIEGFAPWQYPQALIKVQTQIWLVPGKHITGDGIILEFPGLIVNMVSPQLLDTFSPGQDIPLTVTVVMMCGCPLTNKGLWDAGEYEVQAIVRKDGEEIANFLLAFSGKANTFTAEKLPPNNDFNETGYYDVSVYAYHALTGNTGVATSNFIIKEHNR